jgi:CDP-diacylglycerol--glycerol-3-phosphate 3-phosphatidyltransferase
MGVFIGLMVYYTRHAPPSLHTYYLLLISAALVASVMISYTSARAESLIPKCDVGFFRRPERVVLLILGSLLGRMEACIWLMTILSFWTFAHRLYYTWVETRGMDASPPVTSIPQIDQAQKERPEGRHLTLGHKPV